MFIKNKKALLLIIFCTINFTITPSAYAENSCLVSINEEIKREKSRKKDAKFQVRSAERRIAKMEDFARSFRTDKEIRIKALRKNKKKHEKLMKAFDDAKTIWRENSRLLENGDLSEDEIVKLNKIVKENKKRIYKRGIAVKEIEFEISALTYSLQDLEKFREVYNESYIKEKKYLDEVRTKIADILKKITALKDRKKGCRV